MICETYKSTPGLDRFPEGQRFTVYRATHKRLMSEDGSYRKRFHRYIATIIAVALLFGVVLLGLGKFGTTASMFLFLIQGAAFIYLAFRLQHYMNQRIGSVLQSEVR